MPSVAPPLCWYPCWYRAPLLVSSLIEEAKSDGINGRQVPNGATGTEASETHGWRGPATLGAAPAALACGGWLTDFGGKQRLLALGVYPTISLARASQAREGARRLLVDGIDPALEKERRTQEHIDAVTFRAVANEYVTKLKREGRAAATIAKTEWLLGFAHADLGNTPIKAVNAPAVLQVLRGVENRGRFKSARRLRSTIGSVFRYAIATARAEVDPTYSLRGALYPGQGNSSSRNYGSKALGALLRAIDGFSGQPGTRIALLLMAFLFPRPGELRAAAWVELDLERAIWTIPSMRTKMRRPHRVPLARQSIELLLALAAAFPAAALCCFQAFERRRAQSRTIRSTPLCAASVTRRTRSPRMVFARAPQAS